MSFGVSKSKKIGYPHPACGFYERDKGYRCMSERGRGDRRD